MFSFLCRRPPITVTAVVNVHISLPLVAIVLEYMRDWVIRPFATLSDDIRCVVPLPNGDMIASTRNQYSGGDFLQRIYKSGVIARMTTSDTQSRVLDCMSIRSSGALTGWKLGKVWTCDLDLEKNTYTFRTDTRLVMIAAGVTRIAGIRPSGNVVCYLPNKIAVYDIRTNSMSEIYSDLHVERLVGEDELMLSSEEHLGKKVCNWKTHDTKLIKASRGFPITIPFAPYNGGWLNIGYNRIYLYIEGDATDSFMMHTTSVIKHAYPLADGRVLLHAGGAKLDILEL